MPFYEYECSACKYYVEALQKVSDAPMKRCPSCGKETLERLISAPVFRLKGAGWYETDFKSDKEAKRNLVDNGTEDKEPAEKKDADGKDKEDNARVRASKALKQASVRKIDKKVGKKTGKPARPVAKGRQKTAKAIRKAAAKKKIVKKTRVKKAARKAARKPARKK